MSSGKDVDSGRIPGGDQSMGVQGADQSVPRAVVDAMDQRMKRVEQLVETLIGRFDAMEVNTNRVRIDEGGRPRAREDYNGPINQPIRAYRRAQISDDDSEEEELVYERRRPPIRGGYGRGRNRMGYRDYEDDQSDGGDYHLRVDLPYFNGAFNIEEFLDWLADVERFFDYRDVPEERRVKTVACRLKGGASAWWERVQSRRLREGRHPVRTWIRMKQLMKGEFLPPDHEQILFQQYQRCRQGLRTVHEYTAEFMRLAERNDLRESEGQQVARYVDGLKLQIRDKIGVTMLRSMCEAKNMALRAELMLQEKNSWFDGGSREFGVESSNKSTVGTNRATPEVQGGVNNKKDDKVMGKTTMETKDTLKQNNPYAKPILGKCYRCNLPGHRSNECPNRRVVNVIEQKEVEDILCDPNEGEGDVEEEDGEVEPAYVIRRMMLTSKQEESTHRHQLFRTRCTIGGKMFELIIDSGSCENIIGREVVKQLQLPVEEHPNPYTIGWIKATERIEVKERCKVPFSIGKYQDETFCDVVDMSACHVILGRPWQYDVNTQYAGRENVYRLKKGGVKYTLIPLKVTNRAKACQVEGCSFLTIAHHERKLDEGLGESRVVHAPNVKQVWLIDKEEKGKARLSSVIMPLSDFNKFSFYPDDVPFYLDENSGSSSLQVGENGAASSMQGSQGRRPCMAGFHPKPAQSRRL